MVGSLGIGPPSRAGGRDRLMKGPGLFPGPGAGRGDPVPAFGDRLVADPDRFVPPFDQMIPFEAGQHLIERGRRSPDAEIAGLVANFTAGAFPEPEESEGEVLEMGNFGEPRRSIRHNATFFTILRQTERSPRRFQRPSRFVRRVTGDFLTQGPSLDRIEQRQILGGHLGSGRDQEQERWDEVHGLSGWGRLQ